MKIPAFNLIYSSYFPTFSNPLYPVQEIKCTHKFKEEK